MPKTKVKNELFRIFATQRYKKILERVFENEYFLLKHEKKVFLICFFEKKIVTLCAEMVFVHLCRKTQFFVTLQTT